MSVMAKCPKCATSASVPDEAAGRKVRCKKCQTAFVVAANGTPNGATGATTKTKRPGSKANVTPASRSDSSGVHRKPKKSNATLWIVLTVVTLLIAAGTGAGVFFALQPEPTKVAKTKSRPTKDDAVEKVSPKDKNPVVASKDPKNPKDPIEPKTKGPFTPNPKQPTPVGEPRLTDPVTIAPLIESMPLSDIKSFAAIKQLYPLGNHPHKMGMHVVEGSDHFFELYDMKKKDRLAKVKIAEKAELMDVDPEGLTLAVANDEKHFDIYELPSGGYHADDWRPYDTITDKTRFLEGGNFAHIAMVDKNRFLVITTPGFGDLWGIPTKTVEYLIPAPERTEYRKDTVQATRDVVLSQDRTIFAYATDEGIEFRNAKSGKKVGSTPKLSKYGGKPEMECMGFDATGTKLAVYFSANKGEGRPYFHARFSVPAGEELMVETGPDPKVYTMEFVNGDYFVAFERKAATLIDGKGKTAAVCEFRNGGIFAPRVVQGHMAYVFPNEKNVPTLGLVQVPVSGLGAAPPPPPPTKDNPNPLPMPKDKAIDDFFKTGTPPTPPVEKTKDKEKEKEKQRPVVEQQELWEFSGKGIVRKGYQAMSAN